MIQPNTEMVKKILLQGLFQNGFAFYDSFGPQLLQTLKNLKYQWVLKEWQFTGLKAFEQFAHHYYTLSTKKLMKYGAFSPRGFLYSCKCLNNSLKVTLEPFTNFGAKYFPKISQNLCTLLYSIWYLLCFSVHNNWPIIIPPVMAYIFYIFSYICF